jgi:hypothetical protein
MPPSSPDRALRRLIARLAEASAEDREAVLADLSPGEQEEVAQLLASYRGLDIGPTARPPAPTAAWTHAGFSPTLIARLESTAGFGMRIPSPPSEAGFQRPTGPELTPKTLDVLRECAGKTRGLPEPPFPPQAPTSEAGLFRRLWGTRSL